MKSNFIRTLFISFIVSIALLIITSVASYISIKNLLKNAERVNHTNIVLQNLESVLSTMKDAETGQRGYLLTGEKEFLEPYNGSYAKLVATLNTIKEETSDNPKQLESCKELENIIVQRLTILDDIIKTKNTNGVVNIEGLREGKKYMDRAREIVKMMSDRERQLLATRTESLNTFANYTPFLILLVFLFSVIIATLAFFKTKDRFNKQADSLEQSIHLLSEKEWLQSGIAQLNTLMVGDPDIQTLTKKVIEFAATYTKAQAGALYISETVDTLHLTASYALRHDPKNIQLKSGEGFAGQCALSGEEMIATEVPKDKIYISFASGEAKPGNIVAIPINYEGSVIGVIELASFTAFTPNHFAFLKTGAHNIGLAIISSQNRKKLQELLEETQSQTEELQAQHSEMENLNTELEAQTEKLQASEEELRVQQEELMQSNRELEERSRLLEEKNQVIIHRNQEIQKKAEELALSTKYKSEFLANMSHELRTPLNSILLLSRLLSENKDNNLNSEEVSYAKVIRSSGDGLLNLIDEILDLSKIEAGKMQLEYSDVSIREILDDMYSLFTPLAGEKKLELKTNIGLEVPALIRTDKMRLEQILKNLLSNAIKFTSKGYVSLDVMVHPTDNSFINFIVKDSGIGIAQDKQQLVFEAFQQEDGSTRRKYGGTGLGLSISRELTKLLGGEIRLFSELDEGAEFIVSVPVNETTRKPVPPLQEKTETVKPIEKQEEEERIRYINPVTPPAIPDDRDTIKQGDKVLLIIEDDVNFATALINFSRKNGYKVLSAVSGDQGVVLAKEYNPLAILLDIVLPVQDGWEVMEALKSDAKTRHIPVHIMSSMEAKREGLLKGAVDFISKPMALEQLGSIFSKMNGKSRAYSKKILIIEENLQHAKALSLYLESFNLKSVIKSKVADAVTALQKKGAECVILDTGIPDQADYDALETIKKNPGLENLPIIVFTGKYLSKSEENLIKKYADSIIVKTAHSYQRILDEVSLFLHLVTESKTTKKETGQSLGVTNEVLKGKNVLIADDDVRNIFSLTKILEQYKMKVVTATDGKDALRQLEVNPKIDLVLMDIMMPEMDGYEATRQIRKMPKFKKLPILAVTAKAMMGDREKCIEAGASDYISKPVDLDQLISLLRVWLYDRETQ